MNKQNGKKATAVKRGRPARNPESREDQLIARAVNLADKQLSEGSASSQVMTHFLRLGTTKAKLEIEKLKNENELLKAKTKAIESIERQEELFEQVIEAMKQYSGG